jgi:hypothetical protein
MGRDLMYKPPDTKFMLPRKARDQHTNVPETNKSRETYPQNLPWSACNWTRFPKTPVDNKSFL